MATTQVTQTQKVGRAGEITLAILGGGFGLFGGLFALGGGGLQQTGSGAPGRCWRWARDREGGGRPIGNALAGGQPARPDRRRAGLDQGQ